MAAIEVAAEEAKPARSASGASVTLRGLRISLKAFPAATSLPRLEVAQRFLRSAYASVSSLLVNLSTMHLLSRLKLNEPKIRVELRGALDESHVDLLRAAAVFAAAGVDATLKQLVRDGLPDLLERSKDAERAFSEYIARELTDSAGLVEGRSIAKYLVSADPRSKLIEAYILELTGDSLQSAEQVHKAASALGITDQTIHKEINNLQPLFKARNEIVHELDLQPSSKKLSRGRRSRKIAEVIGYCDTAFAVTQLIVNRVAGMLGTVKEEGSSSAVAVRTDAALRSRPKGKGGALKRPRRPRARAVATDIAPNG